MMETLNNYFKKKVDESSDSFAVGDFFRKLEATPTLSLEEMKKLVDSELAQLRKQLEEKLLVEIVSLKQGMSFGELALNNNQPRAATIACKSDCHFAVMNKADYQKCLLTVTKRRIQAILDFLKDLPFLGPHLSRT